MQNRSRAREWLIGLALAMFSLMLPFAAGELVLRSLAPPPDSHNLFVEVPSEVEMRGIPLARGLMGGAPVALNRLGMREREFSAEPAAGRFRIVVLGDSMTFGLGAPQDAVWPRVLETALASAPPAGTTGIEVINLAVPGYNTAQELALLKEVGLGFHPDLVVVGFFYNDVEFTPRQLARRAGSSGAAPSEARSSINLAITALKGHSLLFAYLSPRVGAVMRRFGGKGLGQAASYNAMYAEGQPGWSNARAALLEMKALAALAGAGFAVVVIPAMVNCAPESYPMQPYHDALRDFARANAITLVDPLPALRGVDFSSMWITAPDGLPVAAAHRLLGEAAARGLAPYLAATPLRRTRATSASNSPRSFSKIATK